MNKDLIILHEFVVFFASRLFSDSFPDNPPLKPTLLFKFQIDLQSIEYHMVCVRVDNCH